MRFLQHNHEPAEFDLQNTHKFVGLGFESGLSIGPHSRLIDALLRILASDRGTNHHCQENTFFVPRIQLKR